MGLDTLIKKLPEYAADIKINLDELFSEKTSSIFAPSQLYGVALSVAYSLRCEALLNSIRAEAKIHLEESEAQTCKVASVMMGMNNVYYRFLYTAEDTEQLIRENISPQMLNMRAIKDENFDLYCLAVSILSGCKYCIDVHIKKLTQMGLTHQMFCHVGRIAGTLKAVRDTLEIERMRSYDFVVREASID